MKKITISIAIFLLFFIGISGTIMAQKKLIHYWHFNNFKTVGVNGNPALIPAVKADYSSIDTNKAFITYRVVKGTSLNYKSYWDFVNPGDTVNAKKGFTGGNGLRPRNPWDSMQLMLNLPTTKYKNITIKYATQRSGSGPSLQNFDYTLDSGSSFITTGLSITSYTVTSIANPCNLATINISNTNAENNKNFIFRIRMAQGTGGTAGNNRFDNISLEGDTFIADKSLPLYTISKVAHVNGSTGVADSSGVKCRLTGVVYGVNQTDTGIRFLMRDQSTGITIFSKKIKYYTVAEGDSLMVQGVVNSTRGLAQFINLDTIIKIAGGKTLKNPTIATALNEKNESDLVKISNIMFYTAPSGGKWPTTATNIICHTKDQTDTIVISILPKFSIAGSNLPGSKQFSVIGLSSQLSKSISAPYANNGYFLMPRTSNDVIDGLASPDSLTSIKVTAKSISSLSLSWTKPVSYDNASMNTLVFIKKVNPITLGVSNKTTNYYTANTDFTANGKAFQTDVLAKCVLNSDSAKITVTGLNENTKYQVLIFSVRNLDSSYSEPALASFITDNNFPNAVTGLTVSGNTPTSVKIAWVKPAKYDNAAHSTLVFVKASSAVTAGVPNKSVNTYVANTAFPSGTPYQNDASAFCVHNGDSSSVIVSNLSNTLKYHVMVWVVRNADTLYAGQSTIANGNAVPPPPTTKLIHFWHFNNFPTFAPPSGGSANNFRNTGIHADYSSIDTSKAKLYYRTMDKVSNMYSSYWDAVTGDTVNQRMNVIGGTAFRARNPSDSMQLLLYIATTHYKNIKVSYACQKSSFASGQFQQNYDYSLDAGNTWKNAGLNKKLDSSFGLTPGNGSSLYTKISLSFPNDTLAGNNPNLILRIKFSASPSGIGNPNGLSGNNRFDNFVVEGDTTTAKPQAVVLPTLINKINSSVLMCSIYPNPSNGAITIFAEGEGEKQVNIFDITGKKIIEAQFTNASDNLHLNNLKAGIYFVQISNANQTITRKLIIN